MIEKTNTWGCQLSKVSVEASLRGVNSLTFSMTFVKRRRQL